MKLSKMWQISSQKSSLTKHKGRSMFTTGTNFLAYLFLDFNAL